MDEREDYNFISHYIHTYNKVVSTKLKIENNNKKKTNT